MVFCLCEGDDDMVRKVGEITIKIKQKGVEENHVGKRNVYQVTLVNEVKKKTTFTFYDAVVNFQKPLYHEDLMKMVLKTICSNFYGISPGSNHKSFYKPKSNKGLHDVVTKDWVENIKLFQVLSE